MENNWLASQQIVAAKKELAACATLLCKAQVTGKYSLTSVRQDVLTAAGFGRGIAAAGWSDVAGIAQFLQHPVDGLNGIYSLLSDPAVRSKVGQGVVTDLRTKLDNAKRALTYGRDANATQLGYDLGQITHQTARIATLAYGAAEASVKLATFGVRAGTRALDTIAAAGARVGEKAVVADAGKFSDVLSAADRQHILYGDSPTSGGSLSAGQSRQVALSRDHDSGSGYPQCRRHRDVAPNSGTRRPERAASLPPTATPPTGWHGKRAMGYGSGSSTSRRRAGSSAPFPMPLFRPPAFG